MPDPTHITVTAPPDRVTPIHKEDGIAPGGLQLRVTSATVDRVRYSQSVRRAIARGDLIPCNMAGTAVPSVDLAAAHDELPGGRIVLRDPDPEPGPKVYVHTVEIPQKETR